ncbi:hypothetical protein, partial [Escherichia coli]|uniref:glycine-rich domain-containing protein n=1 Tax=Escherichia coli TaxID=562 RepID=UPI001BC99F23
LMMSLWDALRMNMMISYQELVRTFPSPSAGVSYFKLTLIDAATGQLSEIVHVTARTGDTMTIARAQEGTTARAWSANDIAANMMTAGTLSYILGNFQPLDATLTALAGLATGVDKLPYFTGTDAAAQTDLTQVGRDIIGQSSIANVLSYLGLGDGTGRLVNVQTFTSSGTYTPTAGTKFGIADVVGGGGGGGSNSTTVSAGYASGGQGGGAGSRVVAKLPISGPLSVVVGAGGNGGTPNPSSGNPGGDGGQSSIGGIIATGGRGGAAGAAFNVLPTGANTTSQNAANTIPSGVTLISQHRGKGALSAELYSPTNASSGKGADSDYGFGGPSIAISSGTNNAAGVNATGNGAGGSGAVSITGTGTTGVSVAGGNGSAGIVIVWEYA